MQDAVVHEHLPRIAADPHACPFLHGDLRRAALRKYRFHEAAVSYRIAFRIAGPPAQTVVIVMVGSRQNFYDALRRRLP